jgi:ubiquinone/menaquinone biosynthesis C-methylase UbiE/uncharacterized protein YbaR (Trm112 family)
LAFGFWLLAFGFVLSVPISSVHSVVLVFDNNSARFMNEWLQHSLACPRDKLAVQLSDTTLTCSRGHKYPVVDGIPVMLRDDVEPTHPYIRKTLDKVNRWKLTGEFDEDHPAGEGEIDGFVQHEVLFTSGNLYQPVQYKLPRYPIPSLRLPSSDRKRFLDIGCNWGRWMIAASKLGYEAVGIDPGIDAIFAARRVAKKLGVDATFVIADARYLPFADNLFDTAFSHSVLPSFSKTNVALALDEIARVLKPSGSSLLQMPNKYGIRQYQQHRRRGFTDGEAFETRYWAPNELMNTFEERIGPTKMTADCFFGLGIQASDVDLLPLRYRAIVYSSEILRRISTIFSPLTKVADSVYLESVSRKN